MELVNRDNLKGSSVVFYAFLKRLFDIVAGLVGLIILVPLTIIIKVAYMVTGDFYPVFFVQPRIGKNGKIFRLIKYRSMIPNAEKKLKELMQKDEAIRKEYQATKKLLNDPRVTRAGSFIRRWSIDELPQLVNVLIGSMSLVGNRPYLVSEKKDMGEYYKSIIRVKPGITGLWQISGHNNVSFRSRVELEATYADLACLSLDMHILARTFGALVGGNH